MRVDVKSTSLLFTWVYTDIKGRFPRCVYGQEYDQTSLKMANIFERCHECTCVINLSLHRTKFL